MCKNDMNQSIAKQLFLGAIVVAIFVAMFRVQSPQRQDWSRPATTLQPLVLRRSVVPVLAISGEGEAASQANGRRTATAHYVEDQGRQPGGDGQSNRRRDTASLPQLDDSYRPLMLSDADGVSTGRKSASPDAVTHEIVDGDTLERISRRHYGEAYRADVLYEENRDVLDRPDILPLGVKIRIPPMDR